MARIKNDKLVVERRGGTTVIELPEASLINRSELERVCGAIDQVIDTTPQPQVILSFAQVSHLSSTFLGRLIAFNKKVKAKGGRLALTNVSAQLRELFDLTKLSSQIPIYKPGEKVFPTTVAWVTLFGSMAASALVGLYFIFHLIRNGVPSRGEGRWDVVALLAMIWFILAMPLTGAIFFVRRFFIQIGRDVQWLVTAVLILVSLVCFVLFLMAR